jgi:hypothetical protein
MWVMLLGLLVWCLLVWWAVARDRRLHSEPLVITDDIRAALLRIQGAFAAIGTSFQDMIPGIRKAQQSFEELGRALREKP